MIIKEALKFLESEEIREYIQTSEANPDMWVWLDMIAQSRASLADKAEALKEISEKYTFDDSDNFYNPHIMAKQAFFALEETKRTPKGSVFILTECYIDEDVWDNDKFFGDFVKESATPFTMFEKAVAYIEEENTQNYEYDEEISNDICSWYEIARWDLTENGDLIDIFTWFLGNDKIIWGFEHTQRQRDDLNTTLGPFDTWEEAKKYMDATENDIEYDYFFGDNYNLIMPVPYTYGDIITIDMRPFVNVFHAVIIWVSADNRHDCCSPTCLCINKNGVIYFGALKHLSFHFPNFSPLLRAERFTGNLPEWEKPLKIISEYVKKDYTLSDKLFDIDEENHKKGIRTKLTWTDIESIFENGKEDNYDSE